MDIRVRMVLLGLVLGVIVAILVASQGCGTDHGKRRTFHGSAPRVTKVAQGPGFVTLAES